MKVKLSFLVICLYLAGCSNKPQSPLAETAKGAKVYYEGTGSERDVKRFGQFFDIALGDNDLVHADSLANADIVMKMRLSEKEDVDHLYAPVVWIIATSRKGEEYTVKSCNSVSNAESIFTEPVRNVSDFKLPIAWRQGNPDFAVYIDEPVLKGPQGLVEALKTTLAEQHYRITGTASDADAELKSMTVQKFIVPVRTILHSQDYEIVDKSSGRLFSGSGSSRTYLGVEKSVNLKDLPCGETMNTFGNSSSDDPFWSKAKNIAKSIHEHISKQAAHSNEGSH
jgi:hypothetical protein